MPKRAMLRGLISLSLCGVASSARSQSPAARLSRPIEYYNPDWSPDGRSLVFESTLSGKYSIYTINVDGTGLRRLTVDTANSEQASWSHDGMRIAFSSDRAGHLDIYTMNPDGSDQRRVTTTSSGGYYQSSFSPDGKWILFQGRPDNSETRDRVYVVAGDGSGLKQLTDSSYGAEGPRWSPDGKTITFLQVPYPKRHWNEMLEADRAAAKKGQRRMTMRPDGSGLRPVADAIAADQNLSPDGRFSAYTKSVDGFAGLYVSDISTRTERLITGGPAVGPLGYLRTATLTAGMDTVDTYESPRTGGQIRRGNGASVVRSLRQVAGRRWELSDTWLDSAGRVTARQGVRTGRASLATELETVRATGDSASLLVTGDRVTGWVVPQGRPPQLFDGVASDERFAGVVVAMAIAKAKPAIGAVFVAPVASLYGGNPLEIRVDSIRVVRRDTLFRGQGPVPVLVLERNSGGQVWVDETTGAELLARGNAGPERWWWHIRRGIRPPDRY